MKKKTKKCYNETQQKKISIKYMKQQLIAKAH